MLNRGEFLERCGAYAPGGGIGCNQLRMALFQLLQLPEHPVIVGIGNGGVVEHMIAVIVVINLLS